MAGPGLFAVEPREVAVALPSFDEASIDYPYRPIRLVDLDRDGRQDLLVHHAPAAERPGASEPQWVTLLVAR